MEIPVVINIKPISGSSNTGGPYCTWRRLRLSPLGRLTSIPWGDGNQCSKHNEWCDDVLIFTHSHQDPTEALFWVDLQALARDSDEMCIAHLIIQPVFFLRQWFSSILISRTLGFLNLVYILEWHQDEFLEYFRIIQGSLMTYTWLNE